MMNNYIADIYNELGFLSINNNPSKAIKFFNQAVYLTNNENFEYNSNLINALYNQEGLDDALNYIQKIAFDNESIENLIALKTILENLIKLNQQNTKAKFLFSKILHRLHFSKEASDIINDLIKNEEKEEYLYYKIKFLWPEKEFVNIKKICLQLLQLCPDNFIYKINLALAKTYLEEPIKEINKIIELPQVCLSFSSNDFDIFNLGIAYFYKNMCTEAEICFIESIKLEPNFEKYYLIGLSYYMQNIFSEAEKFLLKTVKEKPNWLKVNYFLAMSLYSQNKFNEAEKYFDLALNSNNEFKKDVMFLLKYGVCLFKSNKIELSLNIFLNILKINPKIISAYFNIGSCYFEAKKFIEAEIYYKKAIKLKPDYLEALIELGKTLIRNEKFKEAKKYLKKALKIDPFNKDAADTYYLNFYHGIQEIFNWKNRKKELAELVSLSDSFVKHGLPSPIEAFGSLQLEIPMIKSLEIIKSHSEYLRTYISKYIKVPTIDFTTYEKDPEKKLKVGFLSGCLNNHIIGWILFDFFEHFNKNKFEIFAYSYGKQNYNIYTEKFKKDIENYIDLSEASYQEIVDRIIKDKIDILIDMNLHTDYPREKKNDHKFSVIVFRLAPIQISFLDFPSSKQNINEDYLFTDKITSPLSMEKYFTEKFIYLPENCVNHLNYTHGPKNIASSFKSTANMPPEDKFIYCNFNNPFKIEPEIFKVWLNILKRVPNSVLWLDCRKLTQKQNYLKFAKEQGISQNRLYFFPNNISHIPYFKKVDLFLDSQYYNACSTGIHALSMNCPILTILGETCQSRSSASMLHALGLEELIVNSLVEYENLAVELANNPEKLSKLKNILKNNQKLFNMKQYVKNFEVGLRLAWRNYAQGNLPQHIYIPN